MHNDKRNGAALVERGRATIAAAILGLLLAIWFFGQAVAELIATLAHSAGGTLTARVALQDGELELLTSAWDPGVEFVTGGFATVGANDAPSAVLFDFGIAAACAVLVTLAVLALVLVSAVALLRGRLQWSALSINVIVIGVVTMLGSFVTQNLATTAAESLVQEINSTASTWTEGGYVEGVDFMPVIAGAMIAVFGWSLRGTGKIAEDAFGVV